MKNELEERERNLEKARSWARTRKREECFDASVLRVITKGRGQHFSCSVQIHFTNAVPSSWRPLGRMVVVGVRFLAAEWRR